MTTLLVFSNTKVKVEDSKELFFVNVKDSVPAIQNPIEPQKTETIYDFAEKMPSFPGGDRAMMKFVNDNLKYPLNALSARKQGRVVIQFVVNTDGNISNITVLKKVHPLLDAEAIRIVRLMPKWTPGELEDGTKVSANYNIPIIFRLL